jgi:putative ABC transport system permease protein
MTTLWQDVRYALRMMRRSLGFVVTVLLILAVGIGANTAVFSVVHTVLLKALQALPYDEPGRIVEIEERRIDAGRGPRPTSPRTLVYWREHNQVFDHVAGRNHREMGFAGPGEPFRVSGYAISSCFFSLLGVQPGLGRGFLPEEEQPGRSHVMVVSHAFWQERLDGDPQVLGKSVTADGENYTVVGVMPAGYRDTPSQADVAFWVPLVLDSVNAKEHIWVWARLKRGVSVERARADMAVVEEQLARADPQTYARFIVAVERVVDGWFRSERKVLYPLWGAVVLVLLIACLNVAGLFLVHGNARRQEMAMRAMLGASRGRVLAQVLTESLLLSLAAGLLGILAAFGMIKGIIAVCPANVSGIGETRIDGSVLLFTLGLSLLVGLASGLLPAWKAGNMRPVRTLRNEASGPVIDRTWRRLCNGLVVAQIAVALTLLVGVGMLIQTLVLLQREDLGFRPKNVLVMRLGLAESSYTEGPHVAALAGQILQRVQALPHVRSAAVISLGFYHGPSGGAFMPLLIEGRPADPERAAFARVHVVSAGFFATVGMRILKGRDFVAQDEQGAEKGIIIDERLARRYFPEQEPIGQRIALDIQCQGRIVGVVSSLRDYDALEQDTVVFYRLPAGKFWWPPEVVVKADRDPLRLAPILRAQMADLDKNLEVVSIESLEERLSRMLAPRRFTVVLLGGFAQIALVVAALGLYGLLQYTVAHRTHEIGIRMALGATQGRIIHTVLRQGGLLVLSGAGLGLVGAYAMSRIVASLLYKSRPTDPAMLAVVLTTLLVAAFGACYVPARRAARIDPMVALRYE